MASPSLQRLLACAVSLLFVAGCATEAAARKEGPVVKKITIEGTDQLDDGDIKDKILTTETPWWAFLPFTEKEHFDQNAWQADLRRIERFYEAQGYYQAEVLEDRITPVNGDGVELFVRVKEGAPTTIGEVEINGLEGIDPKHKATAIADLPLVVGEEFREDDWAGVKDTIAGRLKELGYAEANVKGEVEVDIATQKAMVKLNVTPGRRYLFGNIFVAAGARPKVPQKFVIDAVQHEIKPGDVYSESDLANAQARVFQMGVFGGVKVNRGAPNREDGTVPIVVDVREAPFHTIKLGAGGGVDQARNEVRAIGEYTNRNFFGGLRRLTTSAQVGWAFIPNVYDVSQGRGSQGPLLDALAEIEQPQFILADLRAQASIGIENGVEPGYQFFGGRIRAGVIWQPHPAFSIFPSYNFEGYRITGEARLGLNQQPSLIFGCDAGVNPETGEPNPCNVFLSYFEQVIEWDRRNDKLEPTKGYYLSASIQEAFGGSFTYLRVVPDVRGYYSLFDEKITLAGKVRLGTMLPLGDETSPDDTPIINRFFSGGGNSHRGFNNRRLSPLLYVPPVGAEDPVTGVKRRGQLVPIGGNGLVESSFEVRYNPFGGWVFATFFDTGSVTRASLSGENFSGGMHHAVGVGVRYRTVVGPIRADFAYRLPFGRPVDIAGYDGSAVVQSGGCFGLGAPPPSTTPNYAGSPEGQCTFHLSIGEAF